MIQQEEQQNDPHEVGEEQETAVRASHPLGWLPRRLSRGACIWAARPQIAREARADPTATAPLWASRACSRTPRLRSAHAPVVAQSQPRQDKSAASRSSTQRSTI